MYSSNQKKNKKPKWLKLAGLLLVLAIVVLGALEATNTTHIFHKKAALLTKDTGSSSTDSGNTNTKNALKNSGSSSGSTGGPSSTVGQGVHQTAASDSSGHTSASTSASQWKTSASGVITLKSPVAGSTFKSGGLISGTAKVSKVWYRLVDDKAGQIAYGNLNVSNGRFSGTLPFSHYANSGHLDVFSISSGGAEINKVTVNLNF